MDSLILARMAVHWRRFIARRWSPDKVVAGACYGGNLGDIALRDGFLKEAERCRAGKGFSPSLASDLGRSKAASITILGGGAIALPDVIKSLRLHYHSSPTNVAIFGVDFAEESLLGSNRAFLRDIPFISCRFREQAAMVGERLNRTDIKVVPDLAFHFAGRDWSGSSPRIRHGTGINVVPFLTRWTLHGFKDFAIYPGGNSMTRLRGLELASRYRALMRALVVSLLDDAYPVAHLPFSPHDDKVARTILQGLPVTFQRYRPSAVKMLSTMAGLAHVFTSRLHALEFAAMAGTPVSPFFYSTKCRQMAEQLGIDVSNCLAPGMLLEMSTSEAVRVLRSSSFKPSQDILSAALDDLHSSITGCLRSVEHGIP